MTIDTHNNTANGHNRGGEEENKGSDDHKMSEALNGGGNVSIYYKSHYVPSIVSLSLKDRLDLLRRNLSRDFMRKSPPDTLLSACIIKSAVEQFGVF